MRLDVRKVELMAIVECRVCPEKAGITVRPVHTPSYNGAVGSLEFETLGQPVGWRHGHCSACALKKYGPV